MVQKGLSLFVPGQAALPHAGTGTLHSAAQQGDTCVVRAYWCDFVEKSEPLVMMMLFYLGCHYWCACMYACMCVFPCAYIILLSTIPSYYRIIFSSTYLSLFFLPYSNSPHSYHHRLLLK